MKNVPAVVKALNKAYKETKFLLTPFWREQNEKHGVDAVGFCYIGAEAAYHFLGGKEQNYKPYYAVYSEDGNRCTHWWIKNHKIVDPTLSQYTAFGDNPPYHLGKCSGFLTKLPSKKCQILMEVAKKYV